MKREAISVCAFTRRFRGVSRRRRELIAGGENKESAVVLSNKGVGSGDFKGGCELAERLRQVARAGRVPVTKANNFELVRCGKLHTLNDGLFPLFNGMQPDPKLRLSEQQRGTEISTTLGPKNEDKITQKKPRNVGEKPLQLGQCFGPKFHTAKEVCGPENLSGFNQLDTLQGFRSVLKNVGQSPKHSQLAERQRDFVVLALLLSDSAV